MFLMRFQPGVLVSLFSAAYFATETGSSLMMTFHMFQNHLPIALEHYMKIPCIQGV